MNLPLDDSHSLIVHLCTQIAWQTDTDRPYQADSLSQVGFIHCSHPDQILVVANQFYQGISGLILLWIDLQKVNAEIRWEPADGQTFPHIYGALNRDAVVAVTQFPCDQDGVFRNVQHPAPGP